MEIKGGKRLFKASAGKKAVGLTILKTKSS